MFRRCPVCEESLAPEEDLGCHIDSCLRTARAPPAEDGEYAGEEGDDDDDVDVDGISGFEEYEWAGHRRVRATALVEGGLREAHGFLTIERGDEDEELDVEGDDGEGAGRAGKVQYLEEDIITTGDEEEDRGGGESSSSPESKTSNDTATLSKRPLSVQEQLQSLREENESLRQGAATCKVCMDIYSRPVVSLNCWHAHCERCWLRALGTKKLCPQCKVITRPADLRRIYL